MGCDYLQLLFGSRSRSAKAVGFAVLPRRWVVERTFGWLMKHRRLVRNYEVKPENAATFAQIAMIGVMLRRLA